MIDPEDKETYIGTTYLALFVGIVSETFRFLLGLNGLCLPHHSTTVDGLVSGQGFIFRLKALNRGAHGKLVRISKIYADESMKLNEGKRSKLPNRDARIPSRHACFLLPRLTRDSKTKKRRAMLLGRTSHGVARATENL